MHHEMYAGERQSERGQTENEIGQIRLADWAISYCLRHLAEAWHHLPLWDTHTHRQRHTYTALHLQKPMSLSERLCLSSRDLTLSAELVNHAIFFLCITMAQNLVIQKYNNSCCSSITLLTTTTRELQLCHRIGTILSLTEDFLSLQLVE